MKIMLNLYIQTTGNRLV